MRAFIISVWALVMLCPPVHADELSELKSRFEAMQEQMAVMAGRIKQLEDEKRAPAAADVSALEARVEELETAQPRGEQNLLSTLNPQVSVIGDLIFKASEEGAEGDNDFNLREVELAFSANVDTWARGDVIVAIENEDGSTEVALEEGYLTLLETPVDNLQAKFGKFRPFLGKANKMHLHQLPWSDYPLVVQNFLGEEGLSEAGASLSYLIPNPADVFSELTIEAINNSSTVLGGGEDSEAVYLAHWKNFLELSDDTSLELGASHAYGDNSEDDRARTQLSGVDLTLNTRLFGDRRTTSHTEALFNNRERAGDDDINSWGMFSSLEQQLTNRWWAFGRYDFSQTPESSDDETQAYSAGLTFAQSEYVFWRAMYTHTDNTSSDNDNTLWLQLDFSIGPHKPHAYR